MTVPATVPILVVDDYPTMARLTSRVLREIGFGDVDCAGDGNKALEMMRQRAYGLVISDWKMEPVDGLELLKRVRAEPELSHTPFIMVTAEAGAERVAAAREAGVSGYIVKPFNAATLRAKVLGALGASGGFPGKGQ